MRRTAWLAYLALALGALPAASPPSHAQTLAPANEADLTDFYRHPSPALLGQIIVFLDHLPLTASGKVDRSSLTRIDAMTAAPHRAGAPPQDEVERTVDCAAGFGVEDAPQFGDLGVHRMVWIGRQANIHRLADIRLGDLGFGKQRAGIDTVDRCDG